MLSPDSGRCALQSCLTLNHGGEASASKYPPDETVSVSNPTCYLSHQ